jgi:alkanesulfonate monooxygenase
MPARSANRLDVPGKGRPPLQVRFTYSAPSGRNRIAGQAAFPVAPKPAEVRVIEAAGFDRIVLPDALDGLDAFRQASAVLDATDRLGVILPCSPSTGSPTASVRRIASLAGRAEGRLAMFAEARHSPDDRTTHEASFRRLDEYLRLFDQLWLNERPIDHEGEHYRLQRAHIGARPGPRPEMHMGGVSGTALQVAGRHADIFHLAQGRLDETAVLIGRAREAASMRGRSGKLRFAIQVDASCLSGSQQAGMRATGLSLGSETQRLISVLACYRDLGVREFVVGGLGASHAIEAFGQSVAPALRAPARLEAWPSPMQVPSSAFRN